MNEDNDSSSNDVASDFIRKEFWLGIRNTVIFGLVLSLVWGGLSMIVPDGWPALVINVIFLLISGIFAYMMQVQLKLVLPTWFSVLVTALLWLLLFVGIRSLFP